MIIGLDFDNTLACYNDIFSSEAKLKGLVGEKWKGSKYDLKQIINCQQGGETVWQKLQGQVYGPSMKYATLFPGVARFLLRCKLEGHKIFIVSHKTKYGHFDKTKTLLRNESLKWMESQGFFKNNIYGINKKNIFFANTQSEKVLKIKSLNLDVFVDDLEEIFLHHDFPEIQQILFSSSSSSQSNAQLFNNWADIEKAAIGEIDKSGIKNLLSSIYGEPIDSVEKLKGRGNSRIYKLSFIEKNSILLKEYPDLLVDSRPRMQTEVSAIKLVEGIGLTPKLLAFNKPHNIAFYEFIEGKSLFTIKDNHINQALNFIENLQEIKGNAAWGEASEACLSATQLMSQIYFRYDRLLKTKNKDLNEFLVNTFKPLLKKVSKYSQTNWPSNNFENELPMRKQIFSPSDFGFHNSILKDNGDIVFLDFEYFGRDDPVKLVADFVWHPGMKLTNSQKTDWVKGAFNIFKNDPELVKRFSSAWPLYGLRWALIVLNEFLEDGWHKRAYANNNLRFLYKKKLASQLFKAKSICEKIQVTNMKSPYINDLEE